MAGTPPNVRTLKSRREPMGAIGVPPSVDPIFGVMAVIAGARTKA
jgi:hypothetical protein